MKKFICLALFALSLSCNKSDRDFQTPPTKLPWVQAMIKANTPCSCGFFLYSGTLNGHRVIEARVGWIACDGIPVVYDENGTPLFTGWEQQYSNYLQEVQSLELIWSCTP